MSINSTQLDAAFNTNFDGVGQLFAADKVGVAVKLGDLLDQYVGAERPVRQTHPDAERHDQRHRRPARGTLTDRLTALQARYTKQFNALDTLLAKLQSTSNYLTQQLANLPGLHNSTR